MFQIQVCRHWCTYCNLLITDGYDENDEMAKDIAEMINEGQTIPAGWIDPLTPDIAYKDGSKPALPIDYSLSQNHPNPFNPITEISFSLPVTSQVSIDVYNIAGQIVASVAMDQYDAGIHSVIWDASDQASGIYLYRLKAGDFVKSRKMTLLK